MNPKIFVASSVEGLDVAYPIQTNLAHDADLTVWSQGVFSLSETPLDSIVAALERSDFGIFVFSPDDETIIRGTVSDVVRDNVLFELGLFVGHLGRKRCFIVMPDNVELHIPTDLLGVTPAKYSGDRDISEIVATLGPVCHQIRTIIKQEGRLLKQQPLQNNNVLNHRITHLLRNSITKLQSLEFSTLEKIDNTDSEGELDLIQENDELKRKEIFKKLGANIAGAVAKQIENYLSYNDWSENVRVSIKMLIPNESDNQLDWLVRTLVVDPITWDNQYKMLENIESHKIIDNSDFEQVLNGERKFFYHNDLSSLEKEQYKNSSKEWKKRYNATLVVPIKNKPDGRDNIVFYGFLTADTKNLNKNKLFSSNEDSPTLNILAHAADALAIWFIKNDNHVNAILMKVDSFIENEKTLNINGKK